MVPGEVFVQRNVGNLVNVKDLNCMSCLEYTIDHLKIKHILVTGHYNCGALPIPLVAQSTINSLCPSMRCWTLPSSGK